MKRNKTLTILFFICAYSYAQVGINTTLPLQPLHIDPKENNSINIGLEQYNDDFIISKNNGSVSIGTHLPKATIDIMAEPTNTSKIDGLLYPKLTGDQLKSKDEIYKIEQKGSIVYVTDAVTVQSPKTENITAEGLYFYDGDKWQKINNVTQVSNGLSKDNDDIKLGGVLTQPTSIETNLTNKLKITGLRNPDASTKFENLVIDNTGTLKKLPTEQVSGNLNGTIYVQGTNELTIADGKRAKVPGMEFTYTVPSKQTLFFTITGYASKPGDNTVQGSGQGVFELYQDNVKISSAYVAVADATSDKTSGNSNTNLTNLPISCTLLKTVELQPGTYTFHVSIAAWRSDLIVNKIPTNYKGYNNDSESMLSKMTVLVFNN